MLFFFTESIASEILDIVAVAGVLKDGGLRNLPALYLFDETLLTLILGVYAALVTRVERTKLFNVMEASFGTLVIFLYVGSRAGASPLFVGIGTYAVKSLAVSILEEIFWQFVNDIYDVREAKRLTPVISTAGAVGGILGAAAVGILARSVPLNTFRLVAPVVMFSGIFCMNRIHRAAVQEGRLEDSPKKGKKKKKKEVPSIREGMRFVRSSPLFSAMLWMFVLGGVVAPLGDFIFQATADTFTTDKAQYARFLAFYKTGLKAFNIFAQLFISGRLMKRLGLANSQLFTPINNIFKYFLFLPFGGLKTAIYAQGSKKLIEKVIQKPAQRVLFGFAPKAQKSTIRVFIKQMKTNAAIVTLIVLWIILAGLPESFDIPRPETRGGTIRGFAFVLIIFNVAWLLQAIRMRRVFAASLVQILETQEVDFEALEREDFRSFLDRKALMFLWKNLEVADDRRAVFIIDVLGELGDRRLLRPIALLMKKKSGPVRTALIGLVGRIGGKEARAFLENAVGSHEPAIRAAALRALGTNRYEGIDRLAAPLVDDETKEVRVAAAAILLNSTDLPVRRRGAEVLDAMLRSPDRSRRIDAIYLLGQLGVKRNVRAVLPFLKDPAAEVRLEALRSIELLAKERGHELQHLVTPLLKDPIPDVRAEAATLLGILNADEAVPALIDALQAPGAKTKGAAIQTLVDLDAAARDKLVEAVSDPRIDLATKEQILRSMQKVGETERLRELLAPVLQDLLKGTYGRLLALETLPVVEHLDESPGFVFLRKAIKDTNDEVTDLVLSIMIILADPDRYRLIRRGLLAGDRDSRANMLELLESTSEKEIFYLLLPLLDKTGKEERRAIARKLGFAESSPQKTLAKLLRDPNAEIRLAAIYAAAESGVKSVGQEILSLTRSSDAMTAIEARRTAAILGSRIR